MAFNSHLNQQLSASAQKTQTPSKLMVQSATTLQVKPTATVGLTAQSSSPKGIGLHLFGATNKPTQSSGSALDFQNSNNKGSMSLLPQSTTASSPFKSSLTLSQANLRSTTQATSTGYKPSYLRETIKKNSTYLSQSPNKHTQARFQQSMTSASAKKYGQNFSHSKGSASQNKSGATTNFLRRNDQTGAMKNVKNRSGSQFVQAMKPGHHQSSNSITRGGLTQSIGQRHHQQSTEQDLAIESSQTTQRTNQANAQKDNAFTRLHKGGSSVVRSFERNILPQSSSRVRKQQATEQPYSRIQSKPRIPSNTASTNRQGSQTALFNTRDRPTTNVEVNIAQTTYQSNMSGTYSAQVSQANPLESDRTTGSMKCDTGRNGTNENGKNRSKGQKQPRQKSTALPQSSLQAPSQVQHLQYAPQVDPNLPVADFNLESQDTGAQAILSPNISPTANAGATGLSASQSMNRVLTVSKMNESDPNNRQQTQSQENALSFNRMLIENSEARNDRMGLRESKTIAPEQDINALSVLIESNLISGGSIESTEQRNMEISTSSKPKLQLSQKFISPKIGKSAISSTKVGHYNHITSPMNNRLASGSVEKRFIQQTMTQQLRSTANSNKNSNFSKVPPPNSINAAFSPDKRPNISRSQIQSNLYFKRGAKGTADATGAGSNEKSFTRQNSRPHQRMFAPPSSLSLGIGGAPSTSTSPSKTGSKGYMQSTFSHQSKTATATTNAYQLNRVRPYKAGASNAGQSQQQRLLTQSLTSATSSANQNSMKDLQSVRILDQTSSNLATAQSYLPVSKPQAQSAAKQAQPAAAKSGFGNASKKKQTTQTQYSNFQSMPKIQNQRSGLPNRQSNSLYSKGKQMSASKSNVKKSFQPQTQITASNTQKLTEGTLIANETTRTFNEKSSVQNLLPTSTITLSTTTEIKPAAASQLQQHKQDQESHLMTSQSEVAGQSLIKGSSIDNSNPQHQLNKKSLSTVSDLSVGTNQSQVVSYKKKQDLIIDMIQSNLKKSEDYQHGRTSVNFHSVSKNNAPYSRKSSLSNRSGSVKEYATTQEIRSINSSPKVAKEPQTLTEQRARGELIVEPEAQLPLSAKSPSPSKVETSVLASASSDKVFRYHDNKEQVPTKPSEPSSTIGQEEPLQVEDVFNDSQMLQNRMVQEAQANQLTNNAARISILSEIEPAEQPRDASSSENVMSDGDSPQIQDMVQVNKDQHKTMATSTAQSIFAKALANQKKNNVSEYEPQEVTMPATSMQHIFDKAIGENDVTPRRTIDLEVVAEDIHEDRYSLVSSAAKSVAVPNKKQLPMNKEAFVSLYKHLLTEQEKAELQELELEGNMIYYANDIPTRTNAATAVTNKDDEDGYYILQAKDQILYRFEVLKVLGKGSFAQVVSAIDHLNGTRVAVKINRNTEIDHKFAKQEGKLLKFLMDEDPKDEHNIVRMSQHIHFRDHQCFVFELLNTDLFEHLKENEFEGFSEDQIRLYAAQLLQALVFLEKRDVIHCDLKPENILLVDKARKKLKVVDFGSGCLVNEQVYTYVQSRYYRAPEVILRIPYSEKVDIWSLGCILAELYTGEPLFPGNNEQEQLEFIMELCGMFPESMIDKSRKKDHYFDTDYSPFLIEDPQHGILRIPENRKIDEAIPSENGLFLDFISQCLVLDPEARPGAAQALQHPWIRSLTNNFLLSENNQDDGVANENILDVRPSEREFQLTEEEDWTTGAELLPIRQNKKAPKQQKINESLDLQNNMLMGARGEEGAEDLQVEEYFDGQATESDRFMTEPENYEEMAEVGDGLNMRPFNADQNADFREETIKFIETVESQQFRQREEAGARASAAEISPDRPHGSFLADQQRMTSFLSADQQETDIGRKTDAPAPKGINLYPSPKQPGKNMSGKKVQKSPLKPSNDSLVEHYKYEKQSKGSAAAPSLSDLYARGEALLSQSNSAKKKANSNSHSLVEEPKIISMTTSGFNNQQKQ